MGEENPPVVQQISRLSLKQPSQIDFNVPNLSQTWKKWKEEFNLYTDLTLSDADQNRKVKLFLYLIGGQGREIYATFVFAGRGERTLEQITTAFDNYCNPKKSETIERYKFFSRNQISTESYDKYITELKILAATCNFALLHDSLLRDRIVCGILDNNLRERLLRESELDLDKCVQICRATELSKEQLKTLETPSTVHAVRSKQPSHPSSSQKKGKNRRNPSKQSTQTAAMIDCKFCGKTHEMKRSQCPAYGQTCRKCKRPNHFANCCQSKSASKVHKVEQDSDECVEADYFDIRTVKLSSNMQEDSVHSVDNAMYPRQIFTRMNIEEQSVRFQIDTGATCNLIPLHVLKRTGYDGQIEPTNSILTMYDQSQVKPMGRCRVKMVNPKDERRYRVECVVLDDPNCVPTLGSRAVQQMNMIEVQYDHIMVVDEVKPPLSVEQLRDEYSDVFKGMGLLEGKYHIELDTSVPPVVHPPRKVPLAIKDKLKSELHRLADLDIIKPVSAPTPWVSSLLTIDKPNKLRICMDPKDLNVAIKRSHYPLSTIEDVLPDLGRAKVFSTLDAKNGFWQVELDEESSHLCTFNTPFGRYRWLRMPFGITSAPEEFQRRQDQVIEGLRGVRGVADDILVYGEGSTFEEASIDHDQNLRGVLDRCRERNLKINPDKVKLRLPEVRFIGHVLTPEGLKPDPEKTRSILEMPSPTDVAGVQRFLGLVNYLSKFLPKLSDACEPLRKLTIKDVEWHWMDQHDKAMQTIKELIAQHPVLRFFDNNDEVTVQCDASPTGLGAALLQQGQPVAYASRALTETETRYAQIEKELLAVVFGVEKFHQYTYGRTVTVHTDHKPLEIIIKKPLQNAPKRLQRMLLRLQKYSVELTYKPGKEMYLADTLSRAPLPNTSTPDEDIESINMASDLPISDERLKDIQDHTDSDDNLQTLRQIIQNGWPEDQLSVPEPVRPFFHHRDELSVQNGILFRGERAVIPITLRKDMMVRIHTSHIGVEGCLRRARECLYWPGMNAEVKDFISKCDICRTNETQQPKETLLPHDVPDRPWSKVATDLCTFSDSDYLVTVDYYSNFWEIDYLPDTKSKTVISKLKAHFTRYGIPDQCISDNGPQFSSDEFKQFSKQWQFEHITSSPAYPQSNGKAEQAVKMAKQLMRKAKQAKTDPCLAILDFRNTPSQGMQSSPSQRLMSRRTKTLLPTTPTLLTPKTEENVVNELKASKKRAAFYYNRGARDLKPLQRGDVVRVSPQGLGDRSWRKAEVLGPVQGRPRSYEIRTDGNSVLRRNRRHLRKSAETPTTSHSHNDIDDTSSETEKLPDQPTEQSSKPESPPCSSSSDVRTRSGRTVRPPTYLNDFETN